MASTTFSGPVTSTNGFVGNLTGTVTGNLVIPTATVAATGSTAANAAAIAAGFTLVTAADGTKGVKLPTASAGLVAIVKNGAASVLKLYPGTSDKINGGTATTGALELAANTAAILVSYNDVDWYSIPLLPS